MQTTARSRIGRARHFNAGDRITAPPIQVPSTDFTVAAWFRWTTNPSPYYGGIQGGGGSWELRVMADGHFGATLYQSIGPDVFTEIRSPLAYNDGTWHHVAAVLRSGLVRIYVDGVLVAQDTTNPITSVRTSTLTEIGHVASNFVGDIDEVFVFSRALSDAEIAALVFGSTSSAQYFVGTLSSGASGKFAELSCSLTHAAALTTVMTVAALEGTKAIPVKDSGHLIPGSPAFSLSVAVWYIVYIVYMASFRTHEAGSRGPTERIPSTPEANRQHRSDSGCTPGRGRFSRSGGVDRADEKSNGCENYRGLPRSTIQRGWRRVTKPILGEGRRGAGSRTTRFARKAEVPGRDSGIRRL